MYFLPVFIAAGLLLFSCSYFISLALRSHTHTIPLDHLTIHSYCRAIQLCLYCIFFSFSRLLLSNDIFTDYPNVYLASVIGVLVVLLLGWLVAGNVMKSTICQLALPHKSQMERFGNLLEHVSHWHIVSTCHECGVRQVPQHSSTNKQWALTNAGPERSPRFADKEESARGPGTFR